MPCLLRISLGIPTRDDENSASATLFSEWYATALLPDIMLHSPRELMQNNGRVLNVLMARWGPYQFSKRGPPLMAMDAMALLKWPKVNQLTFTICHTPPADMLMNAWPKESGHEMPWHVFFLPPSGLPWDYSEPPGKVFPGGFLALTTGLHHLCLGILGHPIQLIFYNGKIGIGERLIRLEKLSVDGADSVIRIFRRLIPRLLERKVISFRCQ